MRIVIVDDAESIIVTMKKLVQEKGHQAYGVVPLDPEHASNPTILSSLRKQGVDFFSSEVEAIALAIKNFLPDLVLLDHVLKNCGFSGEDVAEALQMPREKLVGISTGVNQVYCGGKDFSWKDYIQEEDAQKAFQDHVERVLESIS